MGDQKSVLVIIEEDENIHIATKVLEEDKFRVVVARNANEARLKFSNECFAMVVLDMTIKGLKGSEFIDGIRRKERLRNIKDSIPILVLGDKPEEYSRNYAALDNVSFLEMPFTIIEFKKKLFSFTGNSDVIFKNTKVVAKGEYIITEGGTSHEMFWVLTGRFLITKMNHDNNNIIIGEVVAGELVGEMSFLDNLPRSASVQALENSEILVIPHKKFIDVLDHQPRWFKSLMQTMSQRLRDADSKITRKVVNTNQES